MLSRLECYKSLSLSKAGPKENNPPSLHSHVKVIFSQEKLILR